MIDIRNPILLGLGAAVVGLLVLAAAQRVQLQSERAAHANTRTSHAQQLQRIADKASAAAAAAVVAQQAHQMAVAAIDTQRTQEKDHALADNERRRVLDAAGPGRLRIPAVCPGPGAAADLSGTAPAASVDAPAAEIAPDARQAVWDLRAALITERAQLLALQDYARACSAERADLP